MPSGRHGDEKQKQGISRQKPHGNDRPMFPPPQRFNGRGLLHPDILGSQARKIASSNVGVTNFMMKR